jgi:hypothetical protein
MQVNRKTIYERPYRPQRPGGRFFFMPQSEYIDNIAHRITRFQRVLLCVVLLLLSMQLLGTAFHKHDVAGSDADCATCSFVHHLPTGLPELNVGLPAVMLVIAYWLASAGAYHFQPRTSYLIPRSQAPPRV